MTQQNDQILAQFGQEVLDQVEEKQSQYPHVSARNAFAQWASELIFPHLNSDEIFEMIADATERNNFSISYRDEENGVHYLLAAYYTFEPTAYGEEVVSTVVNEFNKLSTSEIVSKLSRDGLFASQLQDSLKHDFEIRLGFILFGHMKDEAMIHLSEEVKSLQGTVIPMVVDLELLFQHYLEATGFRQNASDILLELPLFSEGSSIITVTELEPFSVVANVDLVSYANAVRGYIPRIFDANVRNPLRNNKINKGIEKTLRDPKMRHYFWHYNNGLTILAEEIKPGDGKIFVRGANIVNGCQTTATISSVISKMGTESKTVKIPLLIRFIQVEDQYKEQDLRINIAKYTNAQTPVLPPDFRSNDEEQERIAYGFMNLTPAIFYERKRGQWDTLKKNKIEKARYSRVVKMVDVAQRWYAFMMSPSFAIVNKQEIFFEDGRYKEVFTPPRTAEEYYVAWLIFEQFEAFLKAKRIDAIGKTDQQSVIFLNLSRAKNLVVAHLTHLVGEMIKIKYGGKFDGSTAQTIMDKVVGGELVKSLAPFLIIIVTQYANQLSAEQSWLAAWKTEAAIQALETSLLQNIELYKGGGLDPLSVL